MKSLINRASRYTWNAHFGLLLIRVATGLVFFMHGWMKVNNLSGVEGMFVHMGLGSPVGVFIAFLEVIGGLALMLGVATRFFGVVFGIEMLVAIVLTGFGKGVYQPHEFELLLMLLSFGLALAGSGRYSLYKMECNACGGMLCDEHK
jgi:putative oxidoreductase